MTKKIRPFYKIGFIFSCFFLVTAGNFVPPEVPKTEIIILGTYHMANPGLDSFNLEGDDVLLPERQKEIAEVLTRLEAFKPTKILLESNWDSDRLPNEYQAYLEGKYELTRNEIDQFGFRLAKKMGHKTVYPIDYRMSMDEGVDPDALERLYSAIEPELNRYGKAYSADQSDHLKGATIGQFLAYMNSKTMIDANHFFYMGFDMKAGEGADFPGPEMVANWYKRNILIVHNIMRVANPEGGDRLLVIIGQGHVKILGRLLDDSPYFERQDILEYLPPPKD